MIYFDQASGSFPKAPPVAQAVHDFLLHGAANVNRGSLQLTFNANQLLYRFRKDLLDYFCAKDHAVICTPNVTTALNILIKGFFRPGDHVLVSSLEHNAVMRPLEQMKKQGVEVSIIPCDLRGKIDVDQVESLIQKNTKAILVTAASNVCGTILPLKELGHLAKIKSIPFFVDGAQLAGFLPIDMEKLGIDALGITGHKSLLGPQGTGALLLRNELAQTMKPLLSGGTGSDSHSFSMPDLLPDRLEAGTQNLPGIAGLSAALSWLKDHEEEIRNHEIHLTKLFLQGLEDLPYQVIGIPLEETSSAARVPVVSIDHSDRDMALIALYLEEKAEIATRVGLHCAPLAHKHLQTFPRGSLRFSFGYTQKEEEVNLCLNLLKKAWTEVK